MYVSYISIIVILLNKGHTMACLLGYTAYTNDLLVNNISFLLCRYVVCLSEKPKLLQHTSLFNNTYTDET